MRFWMFGLAFVVLVLALPIGLRYGVIYDPSPAPDSSWIQVEFVLPLIVEVFEGNVEFLFPVSSLGIFFPIISIAHIYLATIGYTIAKREVDFSRVWKLLLIVTVIDAAAFFPTFLTTWGNIPLPLTFLIGLPLAWLGRSLPVITPFDGIETE